MLDLPVVNHPKTPRTQPLSPETAPPIMGARPDWLKVRLSQGPHFKELKHLMRAAQPRTVEQSWQKLGTLLDIVSPTECANYLANSGYAST